jgi:hypothetical protein
LHTALTPRRQHTATLLPDGRVLVAGGEVRDGGTAFVFDPRTGWSQTGSMKELRVRHVAISFPDGCLAVNGLPPVARTDVCLGSRTAVGRWTMFVADDVALDLTP